MESVFKILKDLEMKAVGLDPEGNKIQEGYFVSFRSVGLPIHKDDFDNPFDPLGGHLEKNLQKVEEKLNKPVPEGQAAAADPANAPKTASSTIDENRIFTAQIAKSQKSYLYTFLLVDDKLNLNHMYAVMPGTSKVSDSWWAIITGANGIPTDSVIKPAMKAAYEAAAAKIMDKDGNPTAHYQAYVRYQDEYRNKVKEWHKAYANAFTDPMKLHAWPIEGRTYHDEADEAMARWTGFGFKNEIEAAQDTLAAQGIDPAIALIVRAKNRFQNSLNEFQGIGQLPYTLMLPNSWYDPNEDSGWNTYTSRDFHSESHFVSSSTSYGGGGGFNVGLWSAKAGFEHADKRTAMNVKTDNLEVEFSYCAVDIKRPWLDTSLLNLKNWFLMGNYKKNCISDGTMTQQLPDKNEHSFLPSIVTSLVLIKDLTIRWDNWQTDWENRSSKTDVSASVGFGPFAVHGHYSRADESRDFKAEASGEGLKVPGIQLIGYVSTILPPCPGHDSSEFTGPA